MQSEKVECTNSDLYPGHSHAHVAMRTGEKSVQRFFFIQIALLLSFSTSCAHPFPREIKSVVQSVEKVGSELGAALWCPGLLC